MLRDCCDEYRYVMLGTQLNGIRVVVVAVVVAPAGNRYLHSTDTGQVHTHTHTRTHTDTHSSTIVMEG